MSSEDFQRFAAECEDMADGTRNPKDKAVWKGLAQRWMRCAALAERDELERHQRRTRKRETVH